MNRTERRRLGRARARRLFRAFNRFWHQRGRVWNGKVDQTMRELFGLQRSA